MTILSNEVDFQDELCYYDHQNKTQDNLKSTHNAHISYVLRHKGVTINDHQKANELIMAQQNKELWTKSFKMWVFGLI